MPRGRMAEWQMRAMRGAMRFEFIDGGESQAIITLERRV